MNNNEPLTLNIFLRYCLVPCFLTSMSSWILQSPCHQQKRRTSPLVTKETSFAHFGCDSTGRFSLSLLAMLATSLTICHRCQPCGFNLHMRLAPMQYQNKLLITQVGGCTCIGFIDRALGNIHIDLTITCVIDCCSCLYFYRVHQASCDVWCHSQPTSSCLLQTTPTRPHPSICTVDHILR